MGMKKSNIQRYRHQLAKIAHESENELKEYCAKEIAVRTHQEIVNNLTDEIVNVRSGNLKGSEHFLTWSGSIESNRIQQPKLNFNLQPGQAVVWNDAAYAATLNDGTVTEHLVEIKPIKAKALFWDAYTAEGEAVFSKGHIIVMPPRQPYPFFSKGVESIRDRLKEIMICCLNDYLKLKGLK